MASEMLRKYSLANYVNSVPLYAYFLSMFFDVSVVQLTLACAAGVRRGRKEERRAREAREDGTREDRATGRLQERYYKIVFFIPPSN